MSNTPQPPSHVLKPAQIAVLLGESLRQELEAFPPEKLKALTDWFLAGVSLIRRERVPSLKEVTHEAHTVILTWAYEGHGKNITHMAEALGISRRAAREHLRRHGLYEAPVVNPDAEETGEASAEHDEGTELDLDLVDPVFEELRGQAGPSASYDDEDDEETVPIKFGGDDGK